MQSQIDLSLTQGTVISKHRILGEFLVSCPNFSPQGLTG